MHTTVETTISLMCTLVGFIALVRYYAKKSLTYLFLGTGFIGAGMLQAFHTVVTTPSILSDAPSGIQAMFIWSWTASSNFLSFFLFFSWLFWKKEFWFKSDGVETIELIVYISAPIFMISVFLLLWFVPLPSPYFKLLGVNRPQDGISCLFFILTFIGYFTKGSWKVDEVENWFIICLIFNIFTQLCMATSSHIHDMNFVLAHIFKDLGALAMLIGLLAGMFKLYKSSEKLNLNLESAKKQLEKYSSNLEGLVLERTKDLETKNRELQGAFKEIKTTQSRLATQEKLASLGALTAGIAHELKNPLNFVSNFSILTLRTSGNLEQIVEKNKDVYSDEDKQNLAKMFKTIKENLTLVTDQGKRADTIIKRMLEHSRSEEAEPVFTDINSLLEEYIALAYHGIRAQDSSFNVKIETQFDRSVGKLNVIPSDLSRVFLNLLSNAFFSVNQKKKQAGDSYIPTVTITTKVDPKYFTITFRDNGVGISSYHLPKIFTPFFTTRPVGQGTGLGLSISHDIITQEHQGMLTVDTKEGEFAEFTIRLPLSKLSSK